MQRKINKELNLYKIQPLPPTIKPTFPVHNYWLTNGSRRNFAFSVVCLFVCLFFFFRLLHATPLINGIKVRWPQH